MFNYDAQEIAKKIMESVQKEYSELKKLNVMILGKTGVGKSTLINNMFNEKLADVGVGRPITRKIREKTKEDYPLAIYDTPGLELSGENSAKELLDDVVEVVDKGVKSGDINKAIHCIWYCISTPSHRIEQGEIDFLKDFLKKTSGYSLPVIVVLTQSYSKSDANTLKKEIEKENLPIACIIPILAENFQIDEFTVKAYGLEQLSDIMHSVLPEGVRKTFVSVQKANIDLKKAKAQAVVASSAAAAAATGAAPIPFADAAVLVPEQIAMLAAITAVFGLPAEKRTIVPIISATVGTMGTTVIGRTIASSLLKLIPGAGSAVGGVISATTAAALTTALGEAYISVMVKICKGELDVKDLDSKATKLEMANIFAEKLKIKKGDDAEQCRD